MSESIENPIIIPEEKLHKEPVCTCDDEYALKVCPVHHAELPVKPIVTTITDEHMVKGGYRTWTGITFTCPHCGKDTIMEPMEVCGNCYERVVIKSKALTNEIRRRESSSIS